MTDSTDSINSENPEDSDDFEGEPRSSKTPFQPTGGWRRRFAHALRGCVRGTQGQSSMQVHGVFAIAVPTAAWLTGMNRMQWCVLLLCVFVVLSAELFNTSIELLAKAVTNNHDERIRDALDVSAAAVLVASLGAATVGLILFVSRLVEMWP
ncbi:MAG: diacylglycerol kinase [Planctomycetales bacterium]